MAQENPVRYEKLDSLRGLAAITVMLGHVSNLWLFETQPHSLVYDYVLAPFALGDTGAVTLFFVLSGFVLALPAIDGKPQPYFTFLIRRIFRIYVPYLCAILLALPGAHWLYGHATRADQFQLSWSQPLTWRLVWQHVLFLGIYDNGKIDLPIWSLIYEMRISLVFPFLCAFALRLKGKWLWAIASLLTCLSIGFAHLAPKQVELSDTFHYNALFLIGIFLAREREAMGGWLNRQGEGARFWIAMLFLLAYEVGGPAIRSASARHGSYEYLAQWMTAFGAAGLMIFSMNSAVWKTFLAWPAIRWAGRVSYSIYLLHFIIILYLLHLLSGRAPLLLILLFAVALSLVFSEAFYKYVETPSMNLGRKLTRGSLTAQKNVATSES